MSNGWMQRVTDGARRCRQRLHQAVGAPIKWPLTIKHYYSFESVTDQMKDRELSSPESWDALRTAHPHFVIPEEREEWVAGLQESKDGQDHSLIHRAVRIAEQLKSRGIEDVHSVGCGGAALEYHLKNALPAVHITASDYSPVAVDRLRKVFIECDRVIVCDIRKAKWQDIQPDPKRSVVLMYRVDPHFTNRQWRSVFRSLAESGMENVLFVPDYVLSVQDVWQMQMRFWKAKLQRVPISFVGYDRSEATFESLWRGLYNPEEVSLFWPKAYWLHRISSVATDGPVSRTAGQQF